MPKADLAQAIRGSDTIVVARVVSGTTRSSRMETSAELLLRVVRVVEGEITPGSQIRVRTRGRQWYVRVRASRVPRSGAVKPFTSLWFLHTEGQQYAVVSITPTDGEPERASLWLPDESPGAAVFLDVRRTVGEEIVAALRHMATAHPDRIRPMYGRADPSRYAARALALTEALATLGDQASLLAIYRELAADPSEYLRAIGIGGVIAANDPTGPKQAAAEFRTLFRDGYAGPIAMSLAGYRNPQDGEAVEAIGRLVTENLDVPILQESAAYALNALHTREAMPALVALLDSRDARVGGLALNGICLFVRNAPIVTPQSILSGSWRQSREPAPFRNKHTDDYCWMNPLPASWAPREHIEFWKSWWRDHEHEVMQ